MQLNQEVVDAITAATNKLTAALRASILMEQAFEAFKAADTVKNEVHLLNGLLVGSATQDACYANLEMLVRASNRTLTEARANYKFVVETLTAKD